MNPDHAPEVAIESATAATTVSLRFAADAASAVSIVPTLAPKRRDGNKRRARNRRRRAARSAK